MSILVYVQNREERIESIVIPPKVSYIQKFATIQENRSPDAYKSRDLSGQIVNRSEFNGR